MDSLTYKGYVKQILQYPLMSFEEEVQHSKLVQAGDEEAKKRLIQSNLRLVVSVAQKYQNPYVSIMDLIQEGSLGLITAASKYHYSFNTRFSTYAYAWIVQAISRYVRNKTGAIVIPHRKEEMLRKIHSARLNLLQKLGRDACDEEIAERLNVSLEDVRSANLYSYTFLSIDSEIEEDTGMSLGDAIPDYSFAPENVYMESLEKEKILSMIGKLPEMEQRVIKYRFNFANDEKTKTLRQIGEELGVSAETVRQMEMRAVKRLKAQMFSA